MIYRIIGRLLHESEAVRNLVADRIFFEVSPAKVTGEFIVLSLTTTTVHNHLQNESDCAEPMVQVDFYAADASRAYSGFQAIHNRLSGFSGSVEYLADDGDYDTTRVSSCNLISHRSLTLRPEDASDKWRFRYSGDFQVFHSQAVPTHV